MSQCCSLLVLCIGGVAALTAIAAVAIATNTDHWTHISVVREAVRERGMETSSGQEYFTRAVGLFRVCFPDKERPEVGSPGLFLNGVEDWCYEMLSRTSRLPCLGGQQRWKPRGRKSAEERQGHCGVPKPPRWGESRPKDGQPRSARNAAQKNR